MAYNSDDFMDVYIRMFDPTVGTTFIGDQMGESIRNAIDQSILVETARLAEVRQSTGVPEDEYDDEDEPSDDMYLSRIGYEDKPKEVKKPGFSASEHIQAPPNQDFSANFRTNPCLDIDERHIQHTFSQATHSSGIEPPYQRGWRRGTNPHTGVEELTRTYRNNTISIDEAERVIHHVYDNLMGFLYRQRDRTGRRISDEEIKDLLSGAKANSLIDDFYVDHDFISASIRIILMKGQYQQAFFINDYGAMW